MESIRKQCPLCLCWIPRPARKCGFCGEWIEGEGAPPPAPEPPAGSHRWLITLIVLIVLGYGAIYAVQAVVMWRFMKNAPAFFHRIDDRKPARIEDDLVVPIEEDD